MENSEKYSELFTSLIKRQGANELLTYLEGHTDFFTAPASTRYHCCHEGGLVEHSLNVYEALVKLQDHWGTDYSKETLALVALTHDICKSNYYKIEMRNQKDPSGNWVRVPYYTVDDQFPIPHAQKSLVLTMSFVKLTKDEALAISAHMGGYSEDQSTTSKAFEKSALAVMLHSADLIATYITEKRTD